MSVWASNFSIMPFRLEDTIYKLYLFALESSCMFPDTCQCLGENFFLRIQKNCILTITQAPTVLQLTSF